MLEIISNFQALLFFIQLSYALAVSLGLFATLIFQIIKQTSIEDENPSK